MRGLRQPIFLTKRGTHEDLAAVTVHGGRGHRAVRVAGRHVDGSSELRLANAGAVDGKSAVSASATLSHGRGQASSPTSSLAAPTRAGCRASSSPTSRKTQSFSRRYRGRRQRARRTADRWRCISGLGHADGDLQRPERRGRQRGPDLVDRVPQPVRPRRSTSRAASATATGAIAVAAERRPPRSLRSAARTRSRSTSSTAARTRSSSGGVRQDGRGTPAATASSRRRDRRSAVVARPASAPRRAGGDPRTRCTCWMPLGRFV